jgi:hypothetical protein
MSLALLQAYADSGDEDAPGWNGGVPADAHEWCSGLHNLISAIYGDAQDTGVEPYWYTQCDDEFIEDEEHRRGLPIGTLKPFLNLPYDHNVTVSEVNSGKKATAVGYLLSALARSSTSGMPSRYTFKSLAPTVSYAPCNRGR